MALYRHSKTTTGPTSYSAGGFNVTCGEVEKVTFATVEVLGGGEYLAQIASISGNVVKIKVRDNIEQAVDEGGTSTYTIGAEVSDGTDLSSITFKIYYEGI